MPFDGQRVAHFFGVSKPPFGESVILRARGSVLLQLHRNGSELPGGVQVHVLVKNVAGATLASWVTDLNPITILGFIRRLDLPDDAASIMVTAIDSAEGGPTGRLPYTLILETWPLNAESIVELPAEAVDAESAFPFRLPSVATCKMVDAPSKRHDYIEKFASVNLSSLPMNVPIQRLFSAGGYLLVSPPSGMDLGEKLSVRLLVKHSGDGPYVEVCPPTIILGESTQALEATLTGQQDYSIWRVELVMESSTATTNKAKLDFTRERVMVSPDPFRAEPGWNNARGLVCFDRTVQGAGTTQSTSAFAGRTRLKIVLPSAGSVPIDEAQRKAAETVLLQAASLWVYSCVACMPDNLAIVSINDRVYVSETLYAMMGPGRIPSPAKGLTSSDLEHMFVDFLGNSRVGTGNPFLPYRLTETPQKDFESVCSLKADEKSTPTLKRIQDALCTSSLFGSTATIRVSFKYGDTSCGDDPNIVGCRADHELTQYNIRDYRFVAQPSGTQTGNGPVEVDLLQAIVHEMGHWIGLSHLNSTESIMAASLEQARCIDFETVKALANQTKNPEDAGELEEPQAFMLRKHSTTILPTAN
ncbi:matrixin family metalloprotease [Pseudomonas sp. MDT2-39-1]